MPSGATRITIVSRIYAPEVSAASGLLQSWAQEFRDRGCDVTVVTTRPPRGLAPTDIEGISVRRARVVRDRQQYVRGYVSYLSYDIPLAFRLLFSRRPDLYVVEPPPTTVAVVRLVAALHRTPYVVDAADLWSDAAAMATDSRFVLGSLRAVELWGLRGAAHLFAAHEPLISRFREVGIHTDASAIGFGADTTVFRYGPHSDSNTPSPPGPTLVYAGTYSEWHGAGIFIDAFAQIVGRHPNARLIFVGNGQERPALIDKTRALGLEGSIEFALPIQASELAPILASATLSLASLKPAQGYDYAFTTKVYSSLASGCPVLFAGVGPTVDFMRAADETGVGVAVDYDIDAVAAAMERMIDTAPNPAVRERISAWTHARYSLAALAQRVVTTSLALARRR